VNVTTIKVRCGPRSPREGPATINFSDGCRAFELSIIDSLWIIDHRLRRKPLSCLHKAGDDLLAPASFNMALRAPAFLAGGRLKLPLKLTKRWRRGLPGDDPRTIDLIPQCALPKPKLI
jgi:hypothetical protein